MNALRTTALHASRRGIATNAIAPKPYRFRFGNDSLDIPIEAYPLFAVVVGGLGWMTYALTRHLRKTGQDYRWRPTAMETAQESWASRLKFENIAA